MGWTRILSRKSGKQKELFSRNPTESELEAYFAELVTELNLRLLLELEPEKCLIAEGKQDVLIAGNYSRMLWVDSITLSACEEAGEKPVRAWRRVWNFLVKKLNIRR